MQDTAIPKKMYGKLYVTRRRRRQKTRWRDDVSTDLRKMGINEWRERARDREIWRRIVMRPRPTMGCSAIEEEEALRNNIARQNTVESSLIPIHDTTGGFFPSQ
jgi:hypothetical protein